MSAVFIDHATKIALLRAVLVDKLIAVALTRTQR